MTASEKTLHQPKTSDSSSKTSDGKGPGKNPDSMQKNCQQIGHTAVNCGRPFECIKCAGEHELGECLLVDRVDKSLLKCANCGMVQDYWPQGDSYLHITNTRPARFTTALKRSYTFKIPTTDYCIIGKIEEYLTNSNEKIRNSKNIPWEIHQSWRQLLGNTNQTNKLREHWSRKLTDYFGLNNRYKSKTSISPTLTRCIK